MTILYSEKQSPLTISDYDINFTEIRDIIPVINSNLNQISVLNDDINDVIQLIDDLNNNSFQTSNNLSELQDLTNALLNLEVISKTTGDNLYFEIEKSLENNVNSNEILNNLQIGNNALRDSYIIENFPDPEDGENGDIWYSWGIIISGGI